MIRLKVNNKYYENFDRLNVDLRLNTIASTFTFSGISEFFNILNYDRCQVYFNDELLLTGTILNPAIVYTKTPQLRSISGYSKTGILQDSSIPVDLYPLEFNGLSLKEIALKFTNYFGLRLKIFDNAKTQANISFEKVSAAPTDTVKTFLSGLCNQRGIILSHDNYGRLLLYRVLARVKPKLDINFDDGLNISFAANSQGFHSSVTVLRQQQEDNNNTQQVTVQSPFVSGIKRPFVSIVKDGDELTETANKLVCAEARNFKLTVKAEGLLNVRSGFYITLNAPFLKKRTKFLIESVTFDAVKSSQTTTLNLVLPCVYTAQLPPNSPFK